MERLRKHEREAKRQRGQYLTPTALAEEIVDRLHLAPQDKVLEPSFGDGSFIAPLVERFAELHGGTSSISGIRAALKQNIYGVEIDASLYEGYFNQLRQQSPGITRADTNLACADYFRHEFIGPDGFPLQFDLIVGNPPFGGTFDHSIEDELDRRYGARLGEKIKKETYSFFIVRAIDQLKPMGHLVFICSDSFLTIPTMRGLRRLLMTLGSSTVSRLMRFSDEVSYGLVLLEFRKSGPSSCATIDGTVVSIEQMAATGNFSWSSDSDLHRYFTGPKLGDFLVGTGGMTIGKNEWFVREIRAGNSIVETKGFEFFREPITVERELQRARLGHLPRARRHQIEELERAGETVENVRVVDLDQPTLIELPHPSYALYNKASPSIIYSPPSHVVYWADNGKAVLTYKKNGNWYLHGVGGQKFFGREGLTWRLIDNKLTMRYLPAGYILDSGAPCAFLREGTDSDELFFVLGWAQTDLCTRLLKTVLNHTRNIQSKDIERLPYPFWVSQVQKQRAIILVKQLTAAAIAGRRIAKADPEVQELDAIFSYWDEASSRGHAVDREPAAQPELITLS